MKAKMVYVIAALVLVFSLVAAIMPAMPAAAHPGAIHQDAHNPDCAGISSQRDPSTPAQTADSVKQLIEDFVVASGDGVTAREVVRFLEGDVQERLVKAITYGSEYVFNSAGTYSVSAAALSPSKFVVAYEDRGNYNYGTAIIGDVSGTAITYGSEYVFNSAGTGHVSAAALSSSKFVVAYTDNEGNPDPFYGTAVIGDVSGTAITYGSEYVFNSASTFYISAAALSPSKFVVAYKDHGNSYYGTAIIGDVSGTAITYGSEYVFNSAGTYFMSAAALSPSKFVVAYQDRDNSNYATAVIGDVSGTAITYGSEYVFNSASTYVMSAAALSPSKFVVAYKDGGNSYYGTAIIGDVSGTAITYGSEYVFNSAHTDSMSAAALSPSKFVVAYKDGGNSHYGTAIIGDVSGTAITYGSEYVFNSAHTDLMSAAALSPSKFVVAYRDVGNSNYGTAIINEYVPPSSDLVVEDIWTVPESFEPGDRVEVWARVCNTGTAPATGLYATQFYLDGSPICGYAGLDPLNPGNCYERHCIEDWPSDCDPHHIWVVADSLDTIDESNEDNNEGIESFRACVPTICYDSPGYTFTTTECGSNPTSQTLSIWNCGAGDLNWQVSDNAGWLTLSPTAGSSTGETDTVTLSVDKSGMSAGSYPATLTISAAGATNTPQTVPVGLHIYECDPTICHSPSSFSFNANEGGTNPTSQTLSIWNCGEDTLNWQVSDNAGWLTLSPTAGSSTGETDTVTLSVDISGMSAGSYPATLTISAAGATNTPRTIPVSLIIDPITDPTTLTHTWTFYTAGFFPKHLPDAYNGQVVLAGLDLADIPDEVQGVWWYDPAILAYRFWVPGVGGDLMTLTGQFYNYKALVTGACEWEIPLP